MGRRQHGMDRIYNAVRITKDTDGIMLCSLPTLLGDGTRRRRPIVKTNSSVQGYHTAPGDSGPLITDRDPIASLTMFDCRFLAQTVISEANCAEYNQTRFGGNCDALQLDPPDIAHVVLRFNYETHSLMRIILNSSNSANSDDLQSRLARPNATHQPMAACTQWLRDYFYASFFVSGQSPPPTRTRAPPRTGTSHDTCPPGQTPPPRAVDWLFHTFAHRHLSVTKCCDTPGIYKTSPQLK